MFAPSLQQLWEFRQGTSRTREMSTMAAAAPTAPRRFVTWSRSSGRGDHRWLLYCKTRILLITLFSCTDFSYWSIHVGDNGGGWWYVDMLMMRRKRRTRTSTMTKTTKRMTMMYHDHDHEQHDKWYDEPYDELDQDVTFTILSSAEFCHLARCHTSFVLTDHWYGSPICDVPEIAPPWNLPLLQNPPELKMLTTPTVLNMFWGRSLEFLILLHWFQWWFLVFQDMAAVGSKTAVSPSDATEAGKALQSKTSSIQRKTMKNPGAT